MASATGVDFADFLLGALAEPEVDTPGCLTGLGFPNEATAVRMRRTHGR